MAAVLTGAMLAGCRPGGSTVPSGSTTASDLAAGSMKGYELYSWQDGDRWYFSVLVGTNRNKTLDEIRSLSSAFKGIEALEAALKIIPAGQFITWLSGDTLAFPSDDVTARVLQVCKERGLELNIAK
jgi:hypothetical protein